MSERTEEFLKKMQEFFPSTSEEYYQSIIKYGEVLETVIIEDIFMPQILEVLAKNENIILLKNLFNYFEQIVCCDNQELIDTFSITILESLGNDEEILKIAKKYMGYHTKQLQLEADRQLGRKWI